MNRKLLDHLLKVGIVDATQLRSALAKVRLTGGDILEVMLKARMVNEVNLARGLGSFYSFKVVDIARVTPKREALDRAQRGFCTRHQVLPFSVDRTTGELLVAVADPARAIGPLEAFQTKTGQAIRSYVAPMLALRAAIEAYYPGDVHTGFGERDIGGLVPSKFEVSTMGNVPGFESHFGGSPASSRPGRVGVDGFFGDERAPAASADVLAGQQESNALLDDSSGLFGDSEASAGFFRNYSSDMGANEEHDRADIEELQNENEQLRRQLTRIERSLQLEINLLRGFLELLVDEGVVDRKVYLSTIEKLK